MENRSDTASAAAILRELGFVRLVGGPVRLGSDRPLPCRLEGHRRNETPVRDVEVSPFWIARRCVANWEYERCDRRWRRPLTSPDDTHPAVNVTYLNALDYCRWMSERYGLPFSLPSEAQWVFAAAPYGWSFPWGECPDQDSALTRGSAVNGPVHVDDPRFGTNWCGLLHVGGNVSQFVLGHYFAPGHGGATIDGCYCLVKGGNWMLCCQSPGVQRRGLVDVAARLPTVGFRLAVNLP
jgi:formylglycine-generating enzyme required for sulfatase activity